MLKRDKISKLEISLGTVVPIIASLYSKHIHPNNNLFVKDT